MLFTSTNPHFLIWPVINVFDLSGNTTDVVALRRFNFVMSNILMPVVSLFGTAGNIMSIIILYRQGLNKSSNILILALAVADTIYLIGTNNIALKLYSNERGFGFFYSKPIAVFLFVLYNIEMCMEAIGKVTSMIIPSLITFERLLAVFCPLHFSRILTPVRIKTAVVTLFIFAVIIYVHYQVKVGFTYTIDTESNETVGYFVLSDFVDVNSTIYNVSGSVFLYIYGPIPVGISIVGCVVLGFKIRCREHTCRKLINQNVLQNDEKVKSTIGRFFGKFSFNKYFGKKLHVSKENVTPLKKNISQDLDYNFSKEQHLSLELECVFKTNYAKKTNNAGNKPTEELGQEGIITTTNGTNSPRAKRRTTRMLLAVCFVYSITGVFNFTALTMRQNNCLSANSTIALEISRKFILCFNSACNFIIYVALNRNFREAYKAIVCDCRRQLKI